MLKIPGYKRISVLIYAALILAIIAGGIILRMIPSKNSAATISENYLSPYYFDKFQRLVWYGKLPPADVWEFAPDIHPENAPPGLAYISLAIYRIATAYAGDIDLVRFADFFPIIAFILWCLAAWIFFLWQKKDVKYIIVFLAVLAFTPVAISLTSFANYAQETIGVFLLFLSAAAFINVPRLNLLGRFNLAHIWKSDLGKWSITTALLITLLILSWQQFPILYFGAAAIIVFLILQRRFFPAAWFGAVLAAPLFLSELIVRLFVKNDYSSLSMIKDFGLGLWLGFRRDPDMMTAMVRGNWRPVGPAELYQLYGPLMLALAAVGFLVSIVKLKETKHFAALIFGGIALVMVSMFEKEKNLAFGLFLFPIAVALENIFEADRKFTRFDLIRLAQFLRGRTSKILIVTTFILAVFVGGWIFFNKTPVGIAIVTKRNPPKPEISYEARRNDDGTINAKIQLTNRGGTTFFSDELWYGLTSGLHIDVCGAELLQSKAYSRTSAPTWRHHAVYDYARWDDCYFIEVKFKQLRKNQYGEALLKIKPISGAKTAIYYRGWMPETSCILRYKNAAGDTPEERLMAETEGEPCIIRSPAHNDPAAPICPVRVMAARYKLQNFKCNEITL